MKKLLILILAISIFTACEKTTLENSIRNPKSFTTIELQQLQKDTIITSFKDNILYEFQDSLVIRRYQLINLDSANIGSIGHLIFWFLIMFILGIGLGVVIIAKD